MAFPLEELDQGLRIARTVLDVVFDSPGEKWIGTLHHIRDLPCKQRNKECTCCRVYYYNASQECFWSGKGTSSICSIRSKPHTSSYLLLRTTTLLLIAHRYTIPKYFFFRLYRLKHI